MTFSSEIQRRLEAALRLNSPLNKDSVPSNAPSNDQATKEAAETADEEDDAAEDVSYQPYKPQKLNFGYPHPDPVVENSTLSAVKPPDISYNLAIPADVIAKARLSNLQLEAVVYGSQRHLQDLPQPPEPLVAHGQEKIKPNLQTPPPKNTKSNRKRPSPISLCDQPKIPACRAGFMLGDSAGMGKGRTLAAFCYENIMRGRKKHIWISVSKDLYDDAKRDLRDLGLKDYASEHCHLLGNKKYSKLEEKEGLFFATYRSHWTKQQND